MIINEDILLPVRKVVESYGDYFEANLKALALLRCNEDIWYEGDVHFDEDDDFGHRIYEPPNNVRTQVKSLIETGEVQSNEGVILWGNPVEVEFAYTASTGLFDQLE